MTSFSVLLSSACPAAWCSCLFIFHCIPYIKLPRCSVEKETYIYKWSQLKENIWLFEHEFKIGVVNHKITYLCHAYALKLITVRVSTLCCLHRNFHQSSDIPFDTVPKMLPCSLHVLKTYLPKALVCGQRSFLYCRITVLLYAEPHGKKKASWVRGRMSR